MEYWAHTDPESGRHQLLIDHLNHTAALAKQFADIFQAGAAAYRCGLLHDISKFSNAFQRRLRGAPIRVDHSTSGAAEAYRLGDAAAAFCIAGHHGGLPNLGSKADATGTLCARVRSRGGNEIEDYSAFAEEIVIPSAEMPKKLISSRDDGFFYTHLLYSCLVDADWLDTESFMRGDAVQRETGEPLPVLSQKLDAYVAKWWKSTAPINIRRCSILRQLMDAAPREKGLYTLTVPTGGGKTVSSMAFALRHALANGQRRIIYVIPYISIIEQTQTVFKQIFGPENVVAHYADVVYRTDENGNLSDRDNRRYLASENWDAPIILTTAVQFFESLFGNRPSKSRKVHNIAGSVIVFDEAQMLPVCYLSPCVWAISQLVNNYGCTSVLCTATQPSLDRLIRTHIPAGAPELIKNPEENHAFFRRVRYQYDGHRSDAALAAQLSSEPVVLCIVNNRSQAQQLYMQLPEEGRFHLSTTMTAAHRRATLEEIRRLLQSGGTCRVISTSLVEANVDVDFPCVYRAMAGLDSIIQAAGRCNREGKRPAAQSVVHIFDTDAKPPEALQQNIAAARRVIARYADLACAAAVEAYFQCLMYTLKGYEALDEKNIMMKIRQDMAFETVAKTFRLIERDSITVYIASGAGKTLTDTLLRSGPTRDLMRKLGQYAVNVYAQNYQKLDRLGAVRQITENTAVLLDLTYYDAHIGLSLLPEGGEAYIL